MMYLRTVALVFLLVASACGGEDDAATTTEAGSPSEAGSAAGSGNDPTILSTNFDLSALPEDFPEELIPPSWTAGQATDLLGPFVVNFESDMAFADAVAYYDGIFGTGIVVGDPGGELAQWTSDPTWVASALDDDPLLISFTSLADFSE